MANEAAKITKIEGAGRIRTPKGIAAFAYLQRPDDSVFGKNNFRISVFFDKTDEEYIAFVKKLQGFNVLQGKATGRKPNPLPVKLAKAKTAKAAGVEEGTPYIEFVTNSEGNQAPTTIPVFDAGSNRDDTLAVWGGDIVRVEGTIRGWELPTGVGIKGYLNAVQLLKSNHVSQTGVTFEQEDAFLVDDDAASPDSDVDPAGLEEEGGLFEGEASEVAEVEDPTAGLLG